MRLWSLHPSYLDAKGLVALWREGLLAQKVLMGRTKGYRRHPQLERFRQQADPVAAIGAYLGKVHEEAGSRGYNFSAGKIAAPNCRAARIPLAKGQLMFEVEHLLRKLEKRDPEKYRAVRSVRNPRQHPVFKLVRGGVASWEKT